MLQWMSVQFFVCDIFFFFRFNRGPCRKFSTVMYSATDQKVGNQFVCMSVPEYITVGSD